jgi:hypothetical protein
MAVFRDSRFTLTVARTDEAGRLYTAPHAPLGAPARETQGTVEHVAVEGDTWFNLAGRYFADHPRGCGLYWVLCDYQDPPVLDPTLRITPGTIVRVPPAATVRAIFDERRRRLNG